MPSKNLPEVKSPEVPAVENAQEYAAQREVFTSVTLDGKMIEYSVERTSGDIPSIVLNWGNRKRIAMGIAPLAEVNLDEIVEIGNSIALVIESGNVKKYVVPALVNVTTDSTGKQSASRDASVCKICGVSGDHVPDCVAIRKGVADTKMSKSSIFAKAKK